MTPLIHWHLFGMNGRNARSWLGILFGMGLAVAAVGVILWVTSALRSQLNLVYLNDYSGSHYYYSQLRQSNLMRIDLLNGDQAAALDRATILARDCTVFNDIVRNFDAFTIEFEIMSEALDEDIAMLSETYTRCTVFGELLRAWQADPEDADALDAVLAYAAEYDVYLYGAFNRQTTLQDERTVSIRNQSLALIQQFQITLVAIIGFIAIVFTILSLNIRQINRTTTLLEHLNSSLERRIVDRTAEVSAAKERAEAASVAKSLFLANMSHELRTPLNAILGFAQVLNRSATLQPADRQHLEIIHSSGEHLLQLINDVLEMSKIEAGYLHLEPMDFDLHDLLDSVTAMFRERIAAKNLALVTDYAPALPAYIRTDGRKLRQVLINLIGNAIKFTSDGTITLRVDCEQAADGARLRFAVSDTGVGISPIDQTRLFQRFHQAESAASQKEGTGLGLRISREFVRLMGGDIDVRSVVGAGSTFSFTILCSEVERQAAPAAVEERAIVGLAAGQPMQRILIAEDREVNRILLHTLLNLKGFDLRLVENGQEAVDLTASWGPHLVLMDVRMPVLDGLSATRLIKRAQPHVRVIAVTASAFEHQRQEILAAGCDDFVRKPYKAAEIYAVLQQHLSVQFEYASAVPAADSSEATIPEATALAALPPDWLTELEKLAGAARYAQILTHIARIESAHPLIARYFSELASAFRFDVILSAITPHLTKNASPQGNAP